MDSGNLSCTPFAYRSNAAGGFFPLSGSIVWRNSHEAAIKIPADPARTFVLDAFRRSRRGCGRMHDAARPNGKSHGHGRDAPLFSGASNGKHPVSGLHVLRVDPGSERTLQPRADLVHCRLPLSYAFSARRRTIASMVASKFCLVLPREISKLSARRLMLKMALTPIS